MAPKNKKKNAFYFFMKELKETEAKKGYNISIHDMPQIAHPQWRKLSVPEKEKYEEMARKFNNDPNLRGGKLASDGSRVEDNLREKEEEERRVSQMIQGIKRFCNSDLPLKTFKEITSRKTIYFLSFNILCHTDNDEYIPIEVGLVEYSIHHGIHREYHKILNPGSIPIGNAGSAKRHMEDVHQIDVFGEKGAETNMTSVYWDILSFTNPLNDDEYPPVFCLAKDIELTAGCLSWLAKKAGSTTSLHVYDAIFLLLELRVSVGEGLPSNIIAEDLLTKTTFDFHPNTRCDFHDEKDVLHCALGYCKRLCYLLSDAVVLYFDVSLTENHLPSIASKDKDYKISMGGRPARNFGACDLGPKPNLRLDQRTNYYENNSEFAAEVHQAPVVKTCANRQPVSHCLAEEMSRLHLNITPATVPGHGIGRGLRRQT